MFLGKYSWDPHFYPIQVHVRVTLPTFFWNYSSLESPTVWNWFVTWNSPFFANKLCSNNSSHLGQGGTHQSPGISLSIPVLIRSLLSPYHIGLLLLHLLLLQVRKLKHTEQVVCPSNRAGKCLGWKSKQGRLTLYPIFYLYIFISLPFH